MRISRLFGILLVAGVSFAQSAPPEPAKEPLTAEEIMARVAANQDRSEVSRKEYVYRQHVHILSHRPKGRLLREETADYDVVPTPDGTEKKLTQLSGRYLSKGKYDTFSGEPTPGSGNIDRELIQSFRDDVLNEKSKDGLGKNLFPLTTKEQKDYEFKLLGKAVEDGREVYHVGFGPKDKHDITWAGEAFIDTAEFEPVRVFTKLSRRIPFMVRTMLGTDVPGAGFNVVYKREEEGVWFPATFGTEFRIHVLFLFNREMSISLENSGFERTHVKSTMKMVGPAE